MVLNFFLAGVGGFLGSVARYGVTLAAKSLFSPAFPVGTLLVNALGCLAMGAAGGWLEKSGRLESPLFLLVCVGILGGFTTYSAYSWETMLLVRDQQVGLAVLNVLGNLVLGLLAVSLGRYLVEGL